MRYSTIHKNVLQGLITVCSFSDSGNKKYCIEFIKRVTQDSDEGIVLDVEDKIIGDYVACHRSHSYICDLFTEFITIVTTKKDKMLRSSSKLTGKPMRLLKQAGLNEMHIKYIASAANASHKRLVYAENVYVSALQNIANTACELGVQFCEVRNAWR